MTGLDLAGVMTEVGILLRAVKGLRVFDYEAPAVSGVTAIVGYPEEIDYNQEYGPEGFRFDLPIALVAPNPTDRRTRDTLSRYVATAGGHSLKAALESPATLMPAWVGYTHMGEVTVKSVTFDEVTIGGAPYAAALFKVDVSGF